MNSAVQPSQTLLKGNDESIESYPNNLNNLSSTSMQEPQFVNSFFSFKTIWIMTNYDAEDVEVPQYVYSLLCQFNHIWFMTN